MASSKAVTLAKYGLTAALGAAVSLTITTFTATTANITTANVTTLEAVTSDIGTASGYYLRINKQTSGSGKITVRGGSGAYICLWDSDRGGYSMIQTLNGVVSAAIANSSYCP